MALEVLNISPSSGSIDITLDQAITIQFNQPVDEYTLSYGIALYTIKDASWTGPELSIMDSPWTDVNTPGSDYVYIPLSFVTNGNAVTVKPVDNLFPNRKHYLTIIPGNDATRYVSAQTVGLPTYTRAGSSTGTISQSSPYTGLTNGTYSLQFTSQTECSISFNAIYDKDIVISDKITLDNLELNVSGTFEAGDVIELDVFRAVGANVIYKAELTTSSYETVTPGSIQVDDDSVIEEELYIVDTIPENLSIDNITCNPVTLKFNKPLSAGQDIKSKIKITKTDMISSKKRYIDYSYSILGNILKIYLKSVGNPTL